jgi:hypothetical protein
MATYAGPPDRPIQDRHRCHARRRRRGRGSPPSNKTVGGKKTVNIDIVEVDVTVVEVFLWKKKWSSG